ncbi:MAG: gamma-glutamyl-gamma-aminobutyrate hydrolase family protein [SAR324 cluster bacterium]|nr:gamma-glutamyl-gamma-aminobutyrate hydrolase family protein [SAR324 cluster bacterium]
MNEKFLMVVHQKTSIFGRVGDKLQERGYGLERCCPLEGDPLPSCMDDYAGTVIFGGPMSANDEELEGIRKELDWIPSAIDSQKPFLGICLGAQLLAKTLGAEVYLHPEELVEIGYYCLKSTPEGQHLFPESIYAYQWHREGLEIPKGAVLLAEGDRFRNQAFSYGENIYGIQFHVELELERMKIWMKKGAERLKLPGAQQPGEQIEGFYKYDPQILNWLDKFLDCWLAENQEIPVQQKEFVA